MRLGGENDRPFMKIFTAVILWWLVASPLLAQNIRFAGLKRTKPAYLLKVIGRAGAGLPDSLAAQQIAQRVRNTRLFSTVEAEVVAGPTDTAWVLSCREVRTLLPICELGAIQGNQWFRLGLLDENGRGRGIRTVAFYQYNDQHSFYLKQSFPLVFNRWGISYLLRKWSFLEPFFFTKGRKEFYYYTNRNAEIAANYALVANRHDLEIGLGYLQEEFVHTMPDKYLDSPNLFSQNRVSFKVIHNLNYLNFNTFYVDGWANTLNLFNTYEVNDRSPFTSVFNDFRYLKTLPFKANLAFRNRLGISSNSDIFLAPFVLDSYFNIRGIGNRVDRGTASVVMNLEYRQTLWENETFGAQTVAFCDAGSWRKPGGQMADLANSENMVVFMGLGGRLIYKKAYDLILRLDYGWSMKGMGNGFVFGIGQYF
jgi:outer membrane protein assembly factor BamA